MINKTLFFILTLFISVSQAQQVRHTETINDLWDFHKGSLSKPFLNKEDNSWEKVNIPHSWNTQDILDDQDGYYRGDGWYKKTLTIPQVYKNQHVFLLFEAANQVTTLYVNGKQIEKEHIGGYTTFARDITNAVKSGENSIMIKVNNAHNDEIVPQAADFSFYGGIYRDIQLIITKPVHFQVANLGANSVFITTPGVSKTTSKVAVNINGKLTKLIGTNRHQDFLGKANAVSDEIHRNDMRLLKDMGINFLRIAHYPQDPAILEMCNKYGFVSTLEIPFVDKAAANEAGKQNSINMLKEAIRFNYNNPAIVAWNLGNETTMKKPSTFGDKYVKHFVDTHKSLAQTIKDEDPTRASYSVFFREPPYQDNLGIRVTDVVGYNKYYGWYVEELENIDDNLKKLVKSSLELDPDKAFILSEYGGGADPRIRSYKPSRFDFSVEYQFLLHKTYLKSILNIPKIVGANVWNFADFQVEHRKDAVPHVNNKGLVSLDRKKKDAYYLYQAILNKKPFVAITSKIWNKRSGVADQENGLVATQPVTVVGNSKNVELIVNGTSLGKKNFDFSTAIFNVPFQAGTNFVEVISNKDGKILKDFAVIDFTLQPKNLKSKTNPFKEIAINVGAASYFIEKDNVDYLWMPDQAYTTGGFGHIGGTILKHHRRKTVGEETSIKGTNNDPIYQTQLIDINQYKFDVPNGTYELSLLFAELKTKNENIMDVVVNNKTLWSSLNIKKLYGNNRGVAKRFLITVEDNKGVTVDFKALKGKTRLSGIKLRKVN